MTTRVELRLTGSVERYDEGGRLLEAQPFQALQLAAMSPAALAAALASLSEQLTASAWPAGPALVPESSPDGG